MNFIPDIMTKIIKEELNNEEFDIKEEIVSNKKLILPSSTVENTCILKDDVKMENTGIQGKINNFTDLKSLVIWILKVNKPEVHIFSAKIALSVFILGL